MFEELLKSERVVIDDIDNDGNKEVVWGQLQSIKVFRNGELLWEEFLPGVVLNIKVGDLNKDGKKEILVGSSDRRIRVFSPTGSLIKEVQYWSPGDKHSGWVWSIVVDDIDNDNSLEIVVGGMAGIGGEGVDVKAYSFDFTEIWRFRVKRSAFRIAIDDVDKDGAKEIIVTTMGGDIFILNNKGELKKSLNIGAGISALEVADIDKDDKKEIVLGTVDGDLMVLKPSLKEKLKMKISSYQPVQVYNIVAKDLNNDGKIELLVTGRRCVLLLDSKLDIIAKVDANVLVGDIDGDDVEEVVKLYINDVALLKGGKEIWRKKMPERIESGYIFDINKDGKKEILLCMSNGLIKILNHEGKIVKEFESGEQSNIVAAGDINKDNNIEVLVGDIYGGLKIFNIDGELIKEFKLSGEIGAIGILDINRDGELEIIASTKNQGGEVKLIKF